ncbi:MAG: hypothetical protein M3Q23_06740 [Actinomycetota bacterium]|nr:hypothetical protein [Actinomycetota bacterium]
MGAHRRRVMPAVITKSIRPLVVLVAACTLFAGAEVPTSQAMPDVAWGAVHGALAHA